MDPGHRRGLGGAGRRAPRRLRRRRRRRRRGSCRWSGCSPRRSSTSSRLRHRALRPRRSACSSGSTSSVPSPRAPSRSRSSWTCPSWCSAVAVALGGRAPPLVRPTMMATPACGRRDAGRPGVGERHQRARRERWDASLGPLDRRHRRRPLRARARPPAMPRSACRRRWPRCARSGRREPPRPHPRRATEGHSRSCRDLRELPGAAPAFVVSGALVRRRSGSAGADDLPRVLRSRSWAWATRGSACWARRSASAGSSGRCWRSRMGTRRPARGPVRGRARRCGARRSPHRRRSQPGARAARRSRVVGDRQRAARRLRADAPPARHLRTRPAAPCSPCSRSASIGISVGRACSAPCSSTRSGWSGRWSSPGIRCRSRPSSAGRAPAASTTRASLPERAGAAPARDPAVRAAAARRAGADRRRDGAGPLRRRASRS